MSLMNIIRSARMVNAATKLIESLSVDLRNLKEEYGKLHSELESAKDQLAKYLDTIQGLQVDKDQLTCENEKFNEAVELLREYYEGATMWNNRETHYKVGDFLKGLEK